MILSDPDDFRIKSIDFSGLAANCLLRVIKAVQNVKITVFQQLHAKIFLPCIGLKRVQYPRGTEPRKRGPKNKRWPVSASACPRKRGFIL